MVVRMSELYLLEDIIKEKKSTVMDNFMDEINREEKRLISEIEEEMKAITDRALERYREEISKIERDSKIRLSKARIQAREMILKEKEAILENILDSFKNKVSEWRKEKWYVEFLKNCIIEGIKAVKLKNITILPAKDDKEIITSLISDKELFSDFDIETGECVDSIGGVIILSKDGKIRYNNTIEARLIRSSHVIRREISKILFG